MKPAEALAIPVAIGCLVFAFFLLGSREERANQLTKAQRDGLTSAVDDLWLQALELGAARDRWPKVQFVALDKAIGQTRCTRPNPIIEFDAEQLVDRYDLMHDLTVGHEMAHVMTCVEGDLDEMKRHGAAWAGWVARLVPRDVAQRILEEQHTLDEMDLEIDRLTLEAARLSSELEFIRKEEAP
jgi:hypothetical protein